MITRSGVAAAVLTLLLSGCSDPGESSGGGSPAPDTSETTSPAASESPEEATPEAEPTPEVAPATGKVIRVKGLRVTTPEGWIVTDPLPIQQAAAPTDAVGTMISVYRFPNSGLYTVDELGSYEVRDMGARGRRLDDVEVDGQPVYHLTGTIRPGVHAERFGTIVDDERVSVQFEFGAGEGRAERDEVIQSVLATARLG